MTDETQPSRPATAYVYTAVVRANLAGFKLFAV